MPNYPTKPSTSQVHLSSFLEPNTRWLRVKRAAVSTLQREVRLAWGLGGQEDRNIAGETPAGLQACNRVTLSSFKVAPD